MKIGYFTTYYPYTNKQDSKGYTMLYKHGGVEVVAHALATHMAQRGHEVNIFTTSIDAKDSVEIYKNTTIFRYSVNFRINSGNISFKMFWKPLKHDVNVVHAHHGTMSLAGLRYAKRKKVPFILTYHGDPYKSYGGFISTISVYFHTKFLLNKILSGTDIIISPSEHYTNQSEFLRKYKDKVVTIPNGINIKDFEIPYSKEQCRLKLDLPLYDNILLYLGALTPNKGPDLLIKAMPKVIKEITDVKLVVVGTGPMKEELKELSKTLGIYGYEYVRFDGFVGDVFKKALYYKAADVFVFPTLKDIFGIVILESIACGTPIVASNIGGIPDVIKDGETGLLIPPKNPEALANAIIKILQDKTLSSRLSKNGKEEAKKYSWEKIAKDTEKLYKRVINGEFYGA